jgi:hypothetical protein
MRFYYRYVCGLTEPDKIVTEIDPAIFGNLLHSVMEKIYRPYEGGVADREMIGSVIKNNGLLTGYIRGVINEIYHRGAGAEQGGNEEITSNILLTYVKMILKQDSTFAPIIIKGLEKYVATPFKISFEGKDQILSIGGYTDRMDETAGTLRIIDYKTGNIQMEISSVSSLFDEEDEKRNEAWFQILMYCEIMSLLKPGIKVRPSLYAVRNMTGNEFSDRLVIAVGRDDKTVIDDYSSIRQEYSSGLRQTITNMFTGSSSFTMTANTRKCDFCPFARLCRR